MTSIVRTSFVFATALVAAAFLAPSAEAGGFFKKFKCAPAPCPPPVKKSCCVKPVCAPAPVVYQQAPAPCPQTTTACPQTPAPCPQTPTACPQTPAPCPQTTTACCQPAPCPPPVQKTGCFSFFKKCKTAPAPVVYYYAAPTKGCCN